MNKDLKQNIEKAISLRINGKMSYSDISKELGRPLGTIKRWLAPYKFEILESSKNKRKKAAIKGSLKMQEKYSKLRIDAYNSVSVNIEKDLQNKYLRDFISIFIGEGTKRRKSGIAIVNSDPKIILLSLMVIKLFFLKPNKNIILEIRYYNENDNEKELLKYWQGLTNNDPRIDYRTYVQPTVKPFGHNNSNKFGLVKVEIYDTYAKEKLNAYIDYIKEEWTKKFENEFNVTIDRNFKEVVKNK